MPNTTLYGFHEIADLTAPASVVGERVLTTAVDTAIDYHNQLTNSLLELFAARTTLHQTRYKAVSATSLQGLDENGRALPVKGGESYTVALPLEMAGTAYGVNYITQQKQTAADVQEHVRTMLLADAVWVRTKLLQALFTNAPYVYNDPLYGNLTVYGLASGDGIKYANVNGGNATDNHYFAQSAAISDSANPFPAWAQALREHPENAGEVIFFVSSSVATQVRTLTTYYPRRDSNILVGANQTQLANNVIDETRYMGRYIGYIENAGHVFEWSNLPAGYGIGVMTNSTPALGMREDETPSLQGFKRVAQRDDYPYYESQYLRIAGFGGWNRIGALAFQVGSASYTVPAGYGRV